MPDENTFTAENPRQKEGGQAPDSFKNCAEAAKYLEELGYKISERTLYRHWQRDRKIFPDFGSSGFTYENLMKYAARLKKKKTLQKDKDEKYADRLDQEELRIKEANRTLLELRVLREQGRVIEKDLVYQQFASLAVGFENSTKGLAVVEAEDAYELIINAADGPAQFVEIFNDIMDRALNEMAKVNNLEVIFGEEE